VVSPKAIHSLHNWNVKIIGLGGIGSCVAQALAQFLAFHAPDCTLSLIDGDAFYEENKTRMLFQEYDNKALVKAQELSEALNGRIGILPVPHYVTPRNIRKLVVDRDMIFLCVDNHATRKIVSDRCRGLKNTVLFSGGNDGIEEGRTGTFGNVQIYCRLHGRDYTNPLTRFHPEIRNPRDKRPDELGCMALTQNGPQLLFTNLMVAAVMLGTFYAWLLGSLDYEELYFDIARGDFAKARRGVPNETLKKQVTDETVRSPSLRKKKRKERVLN